MCSGAKGTSHLLCGDTIGAQSLCGATGVLINGAGAITTAHSAPVPARYGAQVWHNTVRLDRMIANRAIQKQDTLIL
jgi:hypothetical protein